MSLLDEIAVLASPEALKTQKLHAIDILCKEASVGEGGPLCCKPEGVAACNAAAAALRSSLYDSEMFCRCCDLVLLLCRCSENREAEQWPLVGVPALVDAMKKYLSDPKIQERAAKVCSKFVFGSISRLPLKILNSFVHKALCNICHHADANKLQAGSHGAVQAAISSMRVHVENPVVLEAACGLLCSLSFISKWCLLAAEEGVVERVLQAMAAHRNEAALQDKACLALCNILVGSQEASIQFMREKGISVLACTMRNHQKNADLLAHTCLLAVKALCHGGREATHIMASEDVPTSVLSSMKAHPDSEKLQENACSLLNSLCVDAQIAELLSKVGAIECLKVALASFHHNPTLCVDATFAIEAISKCTAHVHIHEQETQFQVKTKKLRIFLTSIRLMRGPVF